MLSFALLCTFLASLSTSARGIPTAIKSSNSTPIIDLGYAQYQGVSDSTTNVTRFLGIRYAAPPTGNLRWRAPTAPANISGIQQASTQPNQCYQAQQGQGTGSYTRNQSRSFSTLDGRDLPQSSEDCLFLNVYVPGPVSTSQSLPVVVFIHGGGYVSGQAFAWDGSQPVLNSNHNLISVIIQYRLGLFGFLAGSAVKLNGDLNAGLLDQRFALQWVQSHIAKFGGDPSKVTIWGQSAGAGSVLAHVTANNGATNPPLFRGVMTSSIYLPAQLHYNHPIPEATYSAVVAQTNCAKTRDALSCLRVANVSVLEAANAAINLNAFFETSAFLPVIDGTFLTKPIIQSLLQGKANGQALLSFHNTNEGVLFVDQSTKLSPLQYIMHIFPTLTTALASSVVSAYKGFGTNVNQINTLMGESTFICPTYYTQAAFSNAWKGQFAIPPATHLQDLPYYFPGPSPLPLPPVFNNTAFLSSFPTSYFNFVVNLDPNVKVVSHSITPQWPKSSRSILGGPEMLFNKTGTEEPDIRLTTVDAGLISRCQLWEGLLSLTSVRSATR